MGPGESENRPEAGMMSNAAAERTGVAALIRGPKDFWTGVIYVLFGGLAFWIARDYGFGTASRMGPGYFPTILGAILVLIGVTSLVRSFIVPGEPLGKFALKAGVLILVSTVLFGFLVVIWPSAGVLTLLWLIGAYAIVFGIVLLVLAFRLRNLHRRQTSVAR